MKRYGEIGAAITEALGRFADDVRSGRFPEEQHTYSMPEEELEIFAAELQEAREHHERR